MTMENFSEILERELEEAVEVKNKKSLHRYILLLTNNLVKQERFDSQVAESRSDVRVIAESMKQGFVAVDKRFEDMNQRFEEVNKRFDDVNKQFEYMNNRFDDVNKRFEDTNKRFEDMNTRFEDTNVRFGDMSKRFSAMFTFLNIGLGLLILITVLFKFI